jgi:hypothetical protein
MKKKINAKATKTNKANTKPKPNAFERIGSIAVESGMLWLSDPSRVVAGAGSKPMFVDWPDFLHKSGFSREDQAKQKQSMKAHKEGKPVNDDMRAPIMPEFTSHTNNAGISIRTPNGDGLYEAYVKRDSAGSIEEIRILL